MARRPKNPRKRSKLELIQAMKRATAPGTYPGQNRARTFVDRKKKADKNKCRGRVKY